MKNLPRHEIYQREFVHMPWGILIRKILDIIQVCVAQNGSVLDLMCGPGYLLGKIGRRRKDLVLEGVDLNAGFIRHARKKYPEISFRTVNVLSWNPTKKFDLILCTGGIHHLPYEKHASFLKKIMMALNPNGFAIIADPYIDDYSTESERRQAAAKLGYEYILATIENGAPQDVIEAAIDILHNDVLGFEYKTSIKKMEVLLKKLFTKIKITKVWPDTSSEYGDYYIICNQPKEK